MALPGEDSDIFELCEVLTLATDAMEEAAASLVPTGESITVDTRDGNVTGCEISFPVGGVPYSVRAALLEALLPFPGLFAADVEGGDRDIFVDEEGPQKLLKALEVCKEDAAVVSTLWTVLGAMMVKRPAERRTMGSEGGIPMSIVASKMHPDSAEVQVAAMKAMRQMCTKNELNKGLLHDMGATVAIIEALLRFRDNSEVAQACFSAIRQMSINDDTAVQTNNRTELIRYLMGPKYGQDLSPVSPPFMCTLLEIADQHAGDLECSLVAAECLTSQVVNNENCREAVESGVVDALSDMLKAHGSGSAPLVRTVVMAVRNLCANDDNKITFVAEGFSGTVIRAMSAHPSDVLMLEVGCQTIGVMAFKNDENCEQLREQSSIPIILDSLRANPQSMLLFKAGCQALRSLCRVEANREQMLLEGVEDVVSEGMERFVPIDSWYSEFGREVLRDTGSKKFQLGKYGHSQVLLLREGPAKGPELARD